MCARSGWFACRFALADGGGVKSDERFEGLYQKYHSSIYALFLRLGFDASTARDLAQDTFLRVFRSIDVYREGTDWPYLATVARNVASNAFRSRAAEKRAAIEMSVDYIADFLMDDAPAADIVLLESERRKQLASAIATLSPTLRTTLLLYMDGQSYDEIAKTLGITLTAVKSRLHEAKLALRRQWGTAQP
jgi:RNA polymerase sigma-70 factor, ECF subfamily